MRTNNIQYLLSARHLVSVHCLLDVSAVPLFTTATLIHADFPRVVVNTNTDALADAFRSAFASLCLLCCMIFMFLFTFYFFFPALVFHFFTQLLLLLFLPLLLLSLSLETLAAALQAQPYIFKNHNANREIFNLGSINFNPFSILDNSSSYSVSCVALRQ